MPKFDYTFEIENDCIAIAKGYDHAINLSINHDTNWWVTLVRMEDGDYVLDVQIGNHNTILLKAMRDGLRGVDEDQLEVCPKGMYRIDLLAKAIELINGYSHKIIYAMEAFYQAHAVV